MPEYMWGCCCYSLPMMSFSLIFFHPLLFLLSLSQHLSYEESDCYVGNGSDQGNWENCCVFCTIFFFLFFFFLRGLPTLLVSCGTVMN